MKIRAVPLSAALVAACAVGVPEATAATRSVWPTHGQAAYVLGTAKMQASPHTRTAPIASMSKVMTAYLVLKKYPIRAGKTGFTITVTHADVLDWQRRVNRWESTVPVRAGERLTERQALAALLLPSANNVAIMLARKVSGSVAAFVRLMNSTARSLSMKHTTYTDPSGFDARTRSTPQDQVRLAQKAVSLAWLRWMVDRTSYWIPVAATIHNTDTLLHHDGFVGIKTGSMSQSGGCFMFRSYRMVRGHRTVIIGVVMGQYGGNLVQAGLSAAKALVDRVAPKAG